MLNATPVPIFSLDVNGNVAHWNRAAAELTGISPGAILGQSFQDMLLFTEQAATWQREIERLAVGSPPIRLENNWRMNDGSRSWITCSCVRTIGVSETPGVVVCTVTGGLSAIDREELSREFINDRTLELREISRFVHDTISQDLVCLSFSVGKLQLVEGLSSQPETRRVLDLIDGCCRDIRVISGMLEPLSVEGSPVEALIEQYAGYFREEAGLDIRLDLDPLSAECSRELKFLLFAAVQMWISHAIRAGVPADITLRLREHTDEVTLELETVLRPASGRAKMSGVSWFMMRERAAALGGTFELSEEENREFGRIRIPLLIRGQIAPPEMSRR